MRQLKQLMAVLILCLLPAAAAAQTNEGWRSVPPARTVGVPRTNLVPVQQNTGRLPERIAQWQANVCRVRVDHGGSISYGSGVYLGRGLVLTAHHVIRERGNITITLHNGGTYRGSVAGFTQATDVGFVKIATPRETNAKGVLLASKNPARGDVVWRCGYGPDGRLFWHRGQVCGFSSPGVGHGTAWFRFTPYAREGDSGGPVFNDYGELLGDLWGSNPGDNTTTAVLPSTLANALGSTTRTNLVNYHVQCFGGQCYGQGPFYWLRPGQRPQQPGPDLRQPAPGAIQPPQNPQVQPPAITQPGTQPGTPATQPNAQLADLQKQIADLKKQLADLAAKPGTTITKQDVQTIVQNVVQQQQPGLTADQVQQIVNTAVARIQPGTSQAQVAEQIKQALAGTNMPVQIRDSSGRVLQERTYPLNGRVPIKLDFDFERLQRGQQPK